MNEDERELCRITFDWDKENSNTKIYTKELTAQVVKTPTKFKNIIGQFDLLPGNIYFWELKMKYGVHFMVGVVKKETVEKDPDCQFFESDGGYAYYNRGLLRAKGFGLKLAYGSPYSMGDTVGVLFDSHHGTLSFLLNDKNLGPAFVTKDLCKDVYVPAVAMLVDGETVEVVD